MLKGSRRHYLLLAGAVLLCAAAPFQLASAQADGGAGYVQVANGKTDLSGVWWAERYVGGLKPMDGGDIPFTAEGRKRFAAANRGEDPARHICLPQGAARAMTTAYPFRIAQTPALIAMSFEENRVFRRFRVDVPHEDPAAWDPSFMGDSTGVWIGGTFTADTTNFKDSYLDDARLPHSDKLSIRERFALADGGKVLEDLLTIDDPLIYSHPWTARLRFRSRPDIAIEPDDWVCGEQHRDISGLAGIESAPADHPSHRPARPPLFTATPASGAPLTPAQSRIAGIWSGDLPSKEELQGKAVGGVSELDRHFPPALSAIMKPWARTIFEKYKAGEAVAVKTMPTPDNNCLPYIIPGSSPYMLAHEILLAPDRMTMLFQLDHQTRIVRMNSAHQASPKPSFSGDSIGRWEGDTLVVDTVGWNDRSYFSDGAPHSSKLHIVERYQASADGKSLTVMATADDPDALTASYSWTRKLHRDEDYQEYVNGENNQEFACPTDAKGSLYKPLR